MSDTIVQLNESALKGELKNLVRTSVEGTVIDPGIMIATLLRRPAT
ncbi:MAG: hypothetical protein ACOX6D_01950 [Thermoguttaceae bacterium]|jgi:hypothetical protein